jgi:hypothetical protein
MSCSGLIGAAGGTDSGSTGVARLGGGGLRTGRGGAGNGALGGGAGIATSAGGASIGSGATAQDARHDAATKLVAALSRQFRTRRVVATISRQLSPRQLNERDKLSLLS